MNDSTIVQAVMCPTCRRKITFVNYILRGGARVEAAERLGKEQTIWEAAEYHCPYCNAAIPKKLLKRSSLGHTNLTE